MLQEQKRINPAIKFLFPFYPIKISRSTRLLLFIAVMIALKLILSIIAIPIPAFGITISISWVPVMLLGWYFGPILGFFLGMVTDTLGYLCFPSGLWFWMYAIQEPCVAMIGGIFAGISNIRVNKEKANLWIDVLITQIVYFSFAITCYVVLIIWVANPETQFENDDEASKTFYNIYKWVAFGLVTIFMFIVEFLTFYKFKEKKKNPKKLTIALYANCIVVLSMVIFSFLLGPITTVNYFNYMGFNLPPGYLEYGSIFYLIPRVAVQCIKVPIECAALSAIVFCLEPGIKQMMSHINNQWK